MRNSIVRYAVLGLSLGSLVLLLLFIIPVYVGPEALLQASWRVLYVADRTLGGLVPLPPVLSWIVFGFCLGFWLQLFLQELEHPSRASRITRWSVLGVLLVWVLGAQPFMGELTSRRPGIQVRQWWRPETYRPPGTPRVIAELEFRWAPPGTFTKGSPSTEKGRTVDEVQRQVVMPKGFWVGAKEITWKEWLRVMPPPAAQPNPPENLDLPVWGISFEEADAFCKTLSAKTRGTFRLPTESEWEYACRAGTTTAYFFGDNPADLKIYACAGRTLETAETSIPCPASSGHANPWGLMDTHGNVAEWCIPEGTDTSSPPYYVYRGGSWLSTPEACRAASRGIQLLNQAPPPDVGLRVIWEP
ncbi:MAG TPA: formylglycine-generating enzyme family protein [Candidatus Hydrogenedentes bacterium]|nr:formylglycine-generating enzyme family protein [Candidatus Hydrogenedentota bacterium]HPU97595.1 formylglycine-generating enzyme family protein [Candidatus Hydrogenedentota bacterium]